MAEKQNSSSSGVRNQISGNANVSPDGLDMVPTYPEVAANLGDAQKVDLYHANMFAPSGVKYETTPYEQPQKQAKLPQECG